MENNFENTVVTEEKTSPVVNIVNKVKDAVMGVVTKVKEDPKGFGVKLGAIVLAAIIAIVAVFVVIGALSNNYKTPIKTMQKFANQKSYYDMYDRQIALANGFCEKEIKAIAKLYKSTDDYKDELADAKEDFKDAIEERKEELGKNYKVKYKVIEKEKLDKDELKDIRDNYRDQADALENQLEEYEDFESEDWEDMADSMGFDGDKSKAKKYVSILKDLRKEYKGAKVTAGYVLTVEITTTGSELDEPIVEEDEITVVKVNGRWIEL